MSKIEVDLEKMSTLEAEIKLLEKRKLSLQYEIELLVKQSNVFLTQTEKEVAQKKQQCEVEYQEKLTKADKFLKEAKTKFDTAEKRDKDLEAIEKQIKELDNKTKAYSTIANETEALKISCLEREKQAELLIEQYSKTIEELKKLSEQK